MIKFKRINKRQISSVSSLKNNEEPKVELCTQPTNSPKETPTRNSEIEGKFNATEEITINRKDINNQEPLVQVNILSIYYLRNRK